MTDNFQYPHTGSGEGYSNTWLTPKYIIDMFDYEFDLDPCAHPKSLYTAREHYVFTGGLTNKWYGKVYCNPPYGKELGLWVSKFLNHRSGVLLCFARTDTLTLQQLLRCCDWVIFLKGRVKFLNSEGQVGDRPNAPSVLFGINCEPPNIGEEGTLIRINTEEDL